MIFILKCYCSEGIQDCDLAVVHITEEYKKTLLEYRELFQMAKNKSPNLASMHYWDGTADYYAEYGSIVRPGKHKEDEFLLGELHTQYEDGGVVTITAQVDLECFEAVYPARMECDQVIVTAEGVCWEANPKHADDARCQTASLPWEVLLPQIPEIRQNAGGEDPRG